MPVGQPFSGIGSRQKLRVDHPSTPNVPPDNPTAALLPPKEKDAHPADRKAHRPPGCAAVIGIRLLNRPIEPIRGLHVDRLLDKPIGLVFQKFLGALLSLSPGDQPFLGVGQ